MIRANADKADCILNIGDGITALHVKGPRNGENYPLNKIIFATDHLAHDWLFCQLINLDPASTPLFADLPAQQQARLQQQCEEIVHADSFTIAKDFIHAPLINISFAPWQIVRSGWRTLRNHFSRVPSSSASTVSRP